MFRLVETPADVKGRIYLHSMPGRYDPFDLTKEEIARHGISRVVGLTPLGEIRQKSPDYAKAIESGTLPWTQILLPIPDYGVPLDRHPFLDLARSIAEQLRMGESVLIHCGAGIGRTGMLAVCVLVALGVPMTDASKTVKNARSEPETYAQQQVVRWVSDHMAIAR